jgi:hypothetical protein
VNPNSDAPTATIYQFPLTSSADLDKPGVRPAPAAERRQPPLPTVEFGSGWYHEAAMEADRPRKS